MSSAPPDLTALQRWLRWVLTEPRGVDGALADPRPDRPEPKPRLLHAVEEGGGLSAPGRLAVYANVYFERILSALAGDFPATRRALGAASFRRLAADYLRDHPSRTPDIDAVGRGLAAFAAGHPLAASFPWLGDLAALDQAVLECVFLDRAPGLNPAAFAAVQDWSAARLTLDPTVRLLTARWPVERLWRRRRTSDDRPLPVLSARPRWLLVHRRADARVLSLSEAEWTTLRRLADDQPLGAVLAALDPSPAPADVQAWFARWASDGLLSSLLP